MHRNLIDRAQSNEYIDRSRQASTHTAKIQHTENVVAKDADQKPVKTTNYNQYPSYAV